MLAEELALLGGDDELRDAFDEVDLLLARAVAEIERAGLAFEREPEEARRQEDAVDEGDAVLLGEDTLVPAERGARDEARELGIARGVAEGRALARDERALIDAAGDPHLDELRVAQRTDGGTAGHLHLVDGGRDVLGLARTMRLLARRSRRGRARTRRLRAEVRGAARAGLAARLLAGFGRHETELLDPRGALARSDLETPAAEDLLDRLGERGGGGVAEVAIACERAEEDRANVVRDARAGAIDDAEIAVADAHEHVDLAR